MPETPGILRRQIEAYQLGDTIVLQIDGSRIPLTRLGVRLGNGVAVEFDDIPDHGASAIDLPSAPVPDSKLQKLPRSLHRSLKHGSKNLFLINNVPRIVDEHLHISIMADSLGAPEEQHVMVRALDVLVAAPTGAVVSVFSPRTKQPEPVISIGGVPLMPLRTAKMKASEGRAIDRVDYAIPSAMFDGQARRISTSEQTGRTVLIACEEWQPPQDEILRKDIASFVHSNPLSESFPPDEISRIAPLLLRRHANPEELAGLWESSLRALRESGAVDHASALNVYVFGATIDEIMQTPAIAQVRRLFGQRVDFHFVLPTAEAVQYSLDAGLADRVDQLVDMLTERQFLPSLQALDRSDMAVVLPCGVRLTDDFPAQVATIEDGSRDSAVAGVAYTIRQDQVEFVISDVEPSRSPTFEFSGICRGNAITTFGIEVPSVHEGVPTKSLRLSGQEARPFATRSLTSSLSGTMLNPLHVVIGTQNVSVEEFDAVEGIVRALFAQDVSISILASSPSAAQAEVRFEGLPIEFFQAPRGIAAHEMPLRSLANGDATLWMIEFDALEALCAALDVKRLVAALRLGASCVSGIASCTVRPDISSEAQYHIACFTNDLGMD